MGVSSLLSKYKNNEGKCFEIYQNHFREASDLSKSICMAVGSKDHTGKMSTHQRRIGSDILDLFLPYLQERHSEIDMAENFENLHKSINSAKLKFNLDGYRRIGPVCIYDFAFRICCYLNRTKGGMLPNFVYLHADPRKSAVYLGCDVSSGRITIDDLPIAFRESGLMPADIENFLCIYSKEIEDLSSIR